MTAFDVVERLAANLKAEFPELKDIYVDDVKHLDEPCISIEVVSHNAELFSASDVFKNLSLDIIYFGVSASKWLDISERIIALLLPGTQVLDRHIIPRSRPEMVYREHMGHVLVEYEWMDMLTKRSDGAQALSPIQNNNEYIPKSQNDMIETMKELDNIIKEAK